MNNLDKDITTLYRDIIDNGHEKSDRTGTGTLSLFGREIRHNMSDGFPLLTTKKMAWDVIVSELIWFLKGDTNIRYLVDNGCNIWNGDCYKYYSNYHNNHPTIHSNRFDILTQKEFIAKIKSDDKFAEQWGDLGPIYGKQWRDWGGVDQIMTLIKNLVEDPDNRRLIVSAWNVGELSDMKLPPCHYGFQCYTRELSFEERCNIYNKNNNLKTVLSDKFNIFNNHLTKDAKLIILDENKIPKRELSLKWTQRSVDSFLGLPFNIASYGLLLELLAHETNMIAGELIGSLGDTHLYLNHIDQAKEQIGYDYSIEERMGMSTCKSVLIAHDLGDWGYRDDLLIREGIPYHSRTPYKLPKLVINDEFWNPDRSYESFDWTIKGLKKTDFYVIDYESHPTIKAPLSN